MRKLLGFRRPKRKDIESMRLMQTEFSDRELSHPLPKLMEDHTGKTHTALVTGRETKQMARRDFLRYAGLIGVAGALGVLASKIPIVHAPQAPSVGWNLGSGSLVEGPSFVSYIDSSGPTYLARNGATGASDFSETASGAKLFNDVFSQFVTNGRSGWNHAKIGDWTMGASTPAVTFGEGGFKFTGEGGGPNYSAATDIISLPATRLLAGANNQTMFQGTSNKVKNMLAWVISDMDVEANAFTGVTAFDMTASQGLSSAGSRIERMYLNNINTGRSGTNGSFGTALILDGCADITLSQLTDGLSNGSGGFVVPSTVADVQFTNQNTDLKLEECILYSAISVQGVWNFLKVNGGTINTIKYTSAPAVINHTVVRDAYVQPSVANVVGHCFNANGFTVDTVEYEDCWLRPGSLAGNGFTDYVVFLNAGILECLILKSCRLQRFSAGDTVSVTDNSANCGRRRAIAIGSRTDGNFTSVSPYTNDANNFLVEAA